MKILGTLGVYGRTAGRRTEFF